MKTLLILLAALAVILIVIAKIHPIGKKISLYIVLGLIALIMLVPFYMMFVMATHTTSEIYSFPPALWFGSNLATNFHNMVEAEVEYTQRYMEVLRRLGRDIPVLDKSLCHIIASGMFNGIFEIVVHDMPRDQAMRDVDQLRDFYTAGWLKLMGG